MDDLQMWLFVGRLFFFIIVGTCILVFAFLEMIFSPVMVFKYLKPSLFEHLFASLDNNNGSNVNVDQDLPTMTTMITIFYLVHVLVQAVNFFSALALFFGIMHSEYRERFVSFDVGGLFSVALLTSLAVGRILVKNPSSHFDLCSSVLERDIYKRAILVGDANCNGKTCLRTDVFSWHQVHQCCGWRSQTEALRSQAKKRNNNNNGTSSEEALSTLPQFCCLQEPLSSEGLLGSELVNLNNGHNRGHRRAPVVFYNFNSLYGHENGACKLDSVNRFRETCSLLKDSVSFFDLSSASVLVHPCSWTYIVLKLVCSLAYTAVKKHYFVPQAEGIYADSFPI